MSSFNILNLNVHVGTCKTEVSQRMRTGTSLTYVMSVDIYDYPTFEIRIQMWRPHVWPRKYVTVPPER